MILCGDITGKAVVFIVKKADGTYWANFLGNQYALQHDKEMLTLKKQIDDCGYYTYICSQEELDDLNGSRSKQDSVLLDLIQQRTKEWVVEAESRLATSGVELYVLPGNDDPLIIDEAIKSSFVVNPEGRVLEIADGHEMIATGYTNMTPWKAPRDIEDEDLRKRIASMASQLKHPKSAVFALHAPPFGTNLDMAPTLDATFRPKTIAGGVVEIGHVGSKAVRELVQEYQPLLGLHGHVHEAKAVNKIGRTLCFNAGSEYESGTLRGALISMSMEKVENYILTAG